MPAGVNERSNRAR